MSLQDDLATEAIKDLDEYLNTQPIARARVYEMVNNRRSCGEIGAALIKPKRGVWLVLFG